MFGQMTVSLPLTEYCAVVKPQGVIGINVLPIVPVDMVTGSFPTFSRRVMTQPQNVEGAHNAPAGHSEREVTQTTYICTAKRWREFLADADLSAAQKALQNEMIMATQVQNTLLLAQEQRIAAKVMAAANHVNTMTLTSGGTSDGFQFDRYTAGAGTVFSIIETMKGLAYNPDPANCEAVIAMSYDVWTVLKNHPDLLARMGGATASAPAKVQKEVMASLFDVAEILVGEATYDSTPRKTAATYSQVWTWNMLFFHRAKNPMKNAASFGYSFMWSPSMVKNAQPAGDEFGVKNGWRVRQYRDEPIGGGGQWIEVEQWPAEHLLMPDCATLIINAIGSKTPV